MEKNPGKANIVALFDLDGVLIIPGGYRAAVEATINHFSERMGLGKQAPAEEDIALMEACGVTSEWDMVPIFLTIMLANLARGRNEALPQYSLAELIPWIASNAMNVKREYRSIILELVKYLDPNLAPSEAVLNAVEKGRLMPEMRGKRFLADLLGNTRSVRDSVTTRAFQAYILGDKAFRKNYEFSPDFACESFLELHDRSLLASEDQKYLEKMIANGMIWASVITARPSLPPEFGVDGEKVYSPEAEMALRLTGLSDIGMAGFGTMQYLGAQIGKSPDGLIKPSPVQALAAIAFAYKNEETAALRWAAEMAGLIPRVGSTIRLPMNFDLHIFEDSLIGIQACLSAARLLNLAGYQVAVRAWGISENVDKVRALQSVGAVVFAGIHGALQAAFGNVLS